VQDGARRDDQHAVAEARAPGRAEQLGIVAHADAPAAVVQPAESGTIRVAAQRAFREPDDAFVRRERRSRAHAKAIVEAQGDTAYRFQHQAQSVVEDVQPSDRPPPDGEPHGFVPVEPPQAAERIPRPRAVERRPTPSAAQLARGGGRPPTHPTPRRAIPFDPLDRGSRARVRRAGRECIHILQRHAIQDEPRSIESNQLARRIRTRFRRAQDEVPVVAGRDDVQRVRHTQTTRRIEVHVEQVKARVAVDDRDDGGSIERGSSQRDPAQQDEEPEQTSRREAGEDRDGTRSFHSGRDRGARERFAPKLEKFGADLLAQRRLAVGVPDQEAEGAEDAEHHREHEQDRVVQPVREALVAGSDRFLAAVSGEAVGSQQGHGQERSSQAQAGSQDRSASHAADSTAREG
jgi:hypothetical protein